jgi:glycosyltransferase involved in cell wall biosynthesis
METSDLMVAAREPVANPQPIDPATEIVVCIPSFRRPQHLRRTLQSLAEQTTDRRFAIVVVDNDAVGRESAPVAAEFLAGGNLRGLCVVEPKQGNCNAINTAFQTALRTFPAAAHLMMIDDDEVASRDWLERMVEAAETTGADIVGGPVFPVFDDETKRVLRTHPAFCPAYQTSGPVEMIYGCGNCLIRRSVFDRLEESQFDLRFNFLGGGDTDFFMRCRRAGMKFHWDADAVITETVPPARTSPGWVAQRGLRIGAINYHVELKAARTVGARLKLLARLLGRLPLSIFRAIGLIVTEQKLLFALHPIAVAAGSALALFGIEPHQYKASKIVS